MKHLKGTIFFLILLIINFGLFSHTSQAKDTQKEVMKIFNNAKNHLYKKNFDQAIESFRIIIKDFSNHQMEEESLYWLSYSLNKMTRDIENPDQILEVQREALENLKILEKKYPVSKWLDDGRRLKMEIAADLVTKGFKDYKKYITNELNKTDEDIEMKLVAIGTLIHVDKEKAFPILKKAIQSHHHPKMREKAIFVLSQLDDHRIIPMLKEVALNDKNDTVKEKAIFWIGQIRNEESLIQLVEIYNNIKDERVKKKIIFSIFQQESDTSVNQLIKIYKNEKSITLKKKIIFWLGTSKHKKASAFILKILE